MKSTISAGVIGTRCIVATSIVTMVVMVVRIGDRVSGKTCCGGSCDGHSGIDRLDGAAIGVIGGHAAHTGTHRGQYGQEFRKFCDYGVWIHQRQ